MSGESRKDKSLYTLTKKFVELLKTEETVDLNIVTNELNCAKKRRIYDVSNVLEGIGLIKKTQKNLYQYTGKTYKDDISSDSEKLQQLKDQKDSLEKLEKQLDEDLASLKMNYEALATNKTYFYLTRKDFIDAFGDDKSIVIVKDSKNIKIVFENGNLSSLPSIHIHGYIVKPVQVKLVNTKNTEKRLPKIDFDDIALNINDELSNSENDIEESSRLFDRHKVMKKSDDIILFRRCFKSKTYLETDDKSKEELSKNVLTREKFKEKSKFYYICSNNLVLASDYDQPDFISIEPPVDIEYIDNYSTDSPSIHDLFDYNVKPVTPHVMEVDPTDEILEEEYIIEELDEESLDMLQ